jgi:hypothetical protein
MPLVVEANPRWSRAGDVLWALVEPVRGGGYRWEAIADVERNVRRLRAAGIEPALVVQWSPPWAQSIPGMLCSAPRPNTIADFAAFMRAAAQRFSSGDLRVDYWEIWNEPDFRPDEVIGNEGFGCWATYERHTTAATTMDRCCARCIPPSKRAIRMRRCGAAH